MSSRISLRTNHSPKQKSGFRNAKTTKTGRVVGTLLGLPFFAMGAFLCWMMAIQPLLNVASSQSWPQVPCTITTSEVETNHSSDGSTYKVNIHFNYSYEGQQYKDGGSYDFNSASSSGRNSKQSTVKRYPRGKEVQCWVNPDSPEVAVLSRGIPGIVYFVIPFTSIFMFIGAGISLGSLGLLPKGWKLKFNSRHKRVSQAESGEKELKPTTSGAGKAIGMFLVACFWNGIVGIFAKEVVQGFQKGDPEWFLVLFLIPFVCVGIALIGGVFYYLLALANPRFELVLSEGSPRLGETVHLSWKSTGSLHRLQNLQFILEGRESATYRRGTNTSTDHCTFHRQELFATDEADAHSNGSTEVTLPEASMHSFDSANNKIDWHIKVEGPIPRWPDVKDSYPITVRPL